MGIEQHCKVSVENIEALDIEDKDKQLAILQCRSMHEKLKWKPSQKPAEPEEDKDDA